MSFVVSTAAAAGGGTRNDDDDGEYHHWGSEIPRKMDGDTKGNRYLSHIHACRLKEHLHHMKFEKQDTLREKTDMVYNPHRLHLLQLSNQLRKKD